MSSELLVCPRCGASDASPPDLQGFYACAYCGARFRLDPPEARDDGDAAPTAPPAPPDLRLPVGLAVGFGVVFVLAVLVLARARDGASPAPLDARPPARRATPSGAGGAASPAAAVATPTSSTSPTPSAPSAPPEAVSVQVEAPPPKPAPSGTFEQHSVAPGSKDSFYVLGVVTNTSPYPVSRPRVDAVLLDAGGREVGMARGFVGRALGPQESAPVMILVSEPPPHAELRFELQLREATYLPEPAADLRLEPLPAQETRFGWTLAGSVTNDGAEPARFVEVSIAAYDAEDRLVGIASAYAAAAEGLAPGATGRYRTSLMVLAARPARFDLTVRGRR